jgi:hypothetical protein
MLAASRLWVADVVFAGDPIVAVVAVPALDAGAVDAVGRPPEQSRVAHVGAAVVVVVVVGACGVTQPRAGS